MIMNANTVLIIILAIVKEAFQKVVMMYIHPAVSIRCGFLNKKIRYVHQISNPYLYNFAVISIF